MIHCAKAGKAELVIVTRDSDYGVTFENKLYVNDHLKQEFAERVSKRRKLLLYSKLSEALKHFEVPVTPQEEEVESELLARTAIFAAPQPADDRPAGFVSVFAPFGVGTVPKEAPSLE
jgi:hypothetical protein